MKVPAMFLLLSLALPPTPYVAASINFGSLRLQDDLISAIKANDTIRIRRLLNLKPNLTIPLNGEVPVSYAVKLNRWPIAKLIIDSSDEYKNECIRLALKRAVSVSNDVIVGELCKGYQADPDEFLGSVSLLTISILRDSPRTYQALIDAGCQRDRIVMGLHPIHYAASKSPGILLKVIANQGTEARSRFGESALVYAADNSYENMLVLLGAGLKADEKDNDGRTALYWMRNPNDRERRLKLLLDLGLEINARDSSGQSALHYHIVRNDEAMVKLLVRYGADTSLKDGEGRTAQQLAKFRNRQSIASFLGKVSESRRNDEHQTDY